VGAQGVQGQNPGEWFGGKAPPKAYSILRIFGCQTMQNFVYLANRHEPLVKHEKNLGPLGYSACLFAELQL